VTARLQRRGGDGDGGGGRDEGEGDDGWKVECGVGVEWAGEGGEQRSVERGRAMRLITERKAVSRSRGADSASIRVECCVSVLAADATR